LSFHGRLMNCNALMFQSITLKWSTPSRSSGACQPQRYMIRLKQAGIRQSRAWRLEGERHTVSLHDLQPATEYQVRLMTIMCDGQKKHSRWVKVTTLPEESVPQQGLLYNVNMNYYWTHSCCQLLATEHAVMHSVKKR